MSQLNEAPSAPPTRFVLANLLCAVGFGLVAMTICLPSMPQWAELFDVAQANVQLTFSAFVVAFGVTQVIYGPLSDRYGRRRLLMFGFALAAAGSVAGAMASGLTALTFARLATVVGGQLHVHFGWRANFVLIALLAGVLMVTTWRVIPADTVTRTDRAHWLREMLDAYAQLARVPAYIAYVAILALSTASFYIYLAGAPSVLANYGVGPAEVGFFIMFPPMAYIVGSFLTSRLVKYFADAGLMLVGQCISLTGLVILLILAVIGVPSPFAVAGPLILLGFGQGLLMPPTLVGTVSVVPALAGAAAGAAGLAQQLCGAFGGYAIGLFEHRGAVKLALLMLLFMGAAFASQLFLRRHQARR